MTFILTTERLILRDFDPLDFDPFYATTDDPEYRQYYSDAEMTRDFWLEIFERIRSGVNEPDRTAYQLAVCLPSGELIGTCGVRLEDVSHRQASLGCAISRTYWGKGFALEACRRVIDFGFNNLSIHRLYAETNSANGRSLALVERLGFRKEAELIHTRFFSNRWWNTAIYAILEEEW